MRVRAAWLACGMVGAIGLLVAPVRADGGQAAGAAQSQKAEPAKPVTLDDLAGSYEGMATGDEDLPINVVLRVEGGKLVGTITTPTDVLQVLGATLAEDKITLAIDLSGMAGSLAGRYEAGTFIGAWEVAGQAGNFAIKKTGPAPASSAGDPISGEWVGEAIVQGGGMPFTLVLRLAGENVTGEIGSAQGSSPLASGSWKSGTLAITFAYMSGAPVAMGATLQEGRLVGVLDYNTGETQGTWSAVRKQ